MGELATRPARRGFTVPDKIESHTWGFMPEHRMVWAEGHPVDEGLAPASVLPGRLQSLVTAMGDYGVQLPELPRTRVSVGDMRPIRPGVGFGGLRRLDVTANIAASSGEGRALLSGALEVLLTRSNDSQRVVPYFKGGHLETVYVQARGGLLARIYDKGVESASAARYTLVRPEAQFRYRAGSRLDPRAVDGPLLGHLFRHRFRALWQADEGVTIVSDAVRFVDKVMTRVEAGELTYAQGERIIGYQMMRSRARDRRVVPRVTDWRRRQEVLASGCVLASVECEDVEVSLDELHEQLSDSKLWQG